MPPQPVEPDRIGDPPGEVEALAALAEKHDLLVISDEIYARLVYDGAEVRPVASLPGMKERTITINGFSKAYAMTGGGWATSPPPATSRRR